MNTSILGSPSEMWQTTMMPELFITALNLAIFQILIICINSDINVNKIKYVKIRKIIWWTESYIIQFLNKYTIVTMGNCLQNIILKN